LDIAKKCGADYVFNPSKCNLKEEIDKLTDGYGCDVYLEVSGHPASVSQGLNLIARLGRFVCFSVFKEDVLADWSVIGTFFQKQIIKIGFLNASSRKRVLESEFSKVSSRKRVIRSQFMKASL
jgi:threonine dehydrogenase-like Zn-dependent dehydrogenase